MSKFLFEILSEEIPSSLQSQAQKDIKALFQQGLLDREIKYYSINVYSTPRRLTILVDGFADQIADRVEEKKGPKVDANPQAIEGFLKTYELSLEDCTIQNTPKGDFYFYTQTIKGGAVKDIMVDVIVDVLQKMKFKKSMVWNESGVAWARPIRGLLAYFGESLLSFSFAGINSSNITLGHRFLSHGDIVVSSIENYFEQLKNNFVVLDAQIRKQIILEKVQEISKKYNVDYYQNDALIEEICYLVEYPEILVAEIPEKYMFLPKELLIQIIVKNQRYINLINKDGSLYNKYIIVSNLKASDGGETIVAGNNKVLQARLEDGLFFYKADLKSTLLEKSKKLHDISFFEGLGSIYDKTQRVKDLFNTIFKEDQSELCDIYKSDLCSQSVIEVPELQGVMGYYYAKVEGVSEEIALAIKNQYKPQGPSDSLPENLLGAKLAFLDKLDTLIGFFSIGKKPTGSKDPFALRRSAIGIIRIIEEFHIDVDLSNYISTELREFLAERLEVYLSTTYSNDVVKKVITTPHLITFFNIIDIISEVYWIDSRLKSPEGQLAIALKKRVENILKSQKVIEFQFQESLLNDKLELALYRLYLEISNAEVKVLLEAIKEISKLKEPLDAFLDNVQINMSETPEIKNNRIQLLRLILDLCNKVF